MNAENDHGNSPDNKPQTPPDAEARKDSLIEYPSLFPIKVMGIKAEGYVHA
ncbi:MAG: hypothetical protein JWP79_412, partial [Polaromonas sp.]|nr:hypothetical protein [Polaromonas sp.]